MESRIILEKIKRPLECGQLLGCSEFFDSNALMRQAQTFCCGIKRAFLPDDQRAPCNAVELLDIKDKPRNTVKASMYSANLIARTVPKDSERRGAFSLLVWVVLNRERREKRERHKHKKPPFVVVMFLIISRYYVDASKK